MKKIVTASLNYTYLWYVRIDSTDKATNKQTDKLVCIIIRDQVRQEESANFSSAMWQGRKTKNERRIILSRKR